MNAELTPAGATLTIRRTRDRSFVVIEIDRQMTLDATRSQCDKVHAIAVREINAIGTNRSTAFLASPSLWTLPTTGIRESTVLAELFAIERGEA